MQWSCLPVQQGAESLTELLWRLNKRQCFSLYLILIKAKYLLGYSYFSFYLKDNKIPWKYWHRTMKGNNGVCKLFPHQISLMRMLTLLVSLSPPTYLLNPRFCCDRGGIKGIPFSPTAHATLLDTFPEVIRTSWLLPSASNEKGTPRETPGQTGCLERWSKASPGEKADSRPRSGVGGGGGDGAHNSTAERHLMMLRTGRLALCLTADIIVTDALCSGTICVYILALPPHSCVTTDKQLLWALSS